jgi:hypothetical protein
MVAIATLIGIVAWPASYAHAVCSCAPSPVSQGMLEHQFVFTGELIGVEPGDVLTGLNFKVDVIYKGEVTYLQKLATQASPDDCGLVDPPLGKWMVFANQFPPETGPLIVSACSPSAPLVAGEDLAPELTNGHLPADKPRAPPTSDPTVVSIEGELPPDWRPAAVTSIGAMVILGLAARVLAGRRHRVVS